MFLCKINTRAPFPGNRIPASAINSIGQTLINEYPLPNNGASLFTYNAPQLQSSENGVVRGDLRVTSKESMFARYSVYRTTIDATPRLRRLAVQSDAAEIFRDLLLRRPRRLHLRRLRTECSVRAGSG